MKDQRVLAQCNLFGVFGAIPLLLESDPEMKKMIRRSKISIGFIIKDGPSATMRFFKGTAKLTPGVQKCTIKLKFDSCQKFNEMVEGKSKPKVSGKIWHAGFLTGKFTDMTDRLSSYLRPDARSLAYPAFFDLSTTIMLHVIANAIAVVGNHDTAGRFSASNIMDGTIKIGVADGPMIGIEVQNHHLTVLHTAPEECLSEMIFDSIFTARDLFDGKINAIAAIGQGKVRVSGMIPQVDNINRILNRVSMYLA